MKKCSVLILLLTFQMLVLSGCILDPKEIPPPDKEPKIDWPDLKDKDDVFEYLELVYEKRKPEPYYAKLLDEDNFNFRFGDEDYNSGDTPRSWGRTDELNAVRNILSGVSIETYGAVTQVDLTLTPEGEWIAIPQTEPPYIGETWYQKTFSYRYVFTTNTGWDLRTDQDRKALFIVRFTEADGDSIWRIRQWNDDIF